ncbi:hypothetical protein BKD80_05820 [Corynebacterium diphtheriae]|uniref:hypothetical protein n=1 Tax=Corynebacterium diphtheriae TaxID=1717 RepID=UPI00092C00A0|nr:hypothetical protein [Corynebacterium diphtheriae]OJH92123.1 hypothetical protein BKD80_05820 [Corynebacterium diphtheriae]CAB0494877.1 HK97 gp10 family phage protein [Corynebacterium diphtheriae]CAB0592664.1 HK97 gp10 family phage protein [Corynebacterium diphtheriae]CAB0635727.1 HK97 gp10 family phage protein [Corynebacterium diphtheriae]CAB0850807.1 HK97 gp10 family phage protein [Corynebacterium diphtheriae]
MSAGFLQASRLIVGAVDRGVKDAAELLRDHAVQLTPILQGDLRAAMTVDDGTTDHSAMVGNNLVYAARQHEETGWSHPRGGQAKYLEDAAEQKQAQIADTIARAVRSQL